MLTFRVIWKAPPHLAASTNSCCHHGNTASRDNMWPVRCIAHVHAFTQAPLRYGTHVHGFAIQTHTYTHILIHAYFTIHLSPSSFIPHFLHFPFPSLSLNETTSRAHNQAHGPAQHCQRGTHDPIFSSGSIISVL